MPGTRKTLASSKSLLRSRFTQDMTFKWANRSARGRGRMTIMRGQVFDTERNLYRQEEVQMAWRIEVYVHAQDRLQVKMNPIFEYLEISQTPSTTCHISHISCTINQALPTYHQLPKYRFQPFLTRCLLPSSPSPKMNFSQRPSLPAPMTITV